MNAEPDFSAASAYQQSAVRGATPVGLIVALYDTILRDFRRALTAIDAANVECRVFELNHAITVIAHLRDALDHQRGGTAAAQLGRFYELTHGMILEANISGSRQTVLKLVELFSSVRNSWELAERQLSGNQAAAPADAAVTSATAPASAKRSPGTPSASRQSSVDAAPPPNAAGRWSA